MSGYVLSSTFDQLGFDGDGRSNNLYFLTSNLLGNAPAWNNKLLVTQGRKRGMDTERGAECSCKIGRQTDAYGLHGLNEDILRRREEGASLRNLAEFVNERILEAEIDASDVDVAGDAGSVYAALTEDRVSTEKRVNTIDQLNDVGINVKALQEDFVSYQSVRYHLQNCLDMDTGRRGVETIEEGRGVIEWARTREENVIGRTLSRLQRIGAIAGGDLRTSSTVTVECTECESTYMISEFLDRGACECFDDPTPSESD